MALDPFDEDSWKSSIIALEFRLPTPLEEDKRKEFITYKNYALAMAYVLGDENCLAAVAATERFERIERRKDVDVQLLGRILRLAWVTEIHLRSAMELAGPSLVGHNAPHQSYYAPYSMMRAYFLASGLDVPRSHHAHLNAITDAIKQRKDLFPTALATLASGDPKGGSFNVGSPQCPSLNRDVSNLAVFTTENAWSLVGKLLKTTRDRQMDDAVAQWKVRNHVKRISAAQRKDVASKLRDTSLFHGLYRLRVRSDYQDADAFLLGMVSEEEAATFCESLASITSSILSSFELLIARYVGRGAFSEIVEMFADSDRQGLSESTIRKRWNRIQAHI